MTGKIDGKGVVGTNGADGPPVPSGVEGSFGHDCMCSGVFFVPDDPPTRGGKGGKGAKGAAGSNGSKGGSGKTIEIHVQTLDSSSP